MTTLVIRQITALVKPHPTNIPLGCCHGLLGVDDLSQPDIHNKMPDRHFMNV
jgi:hypothetical protein